MLAALHPLSQTAVIVLVPIALILFVFAVFYLVRPK
jgi:hypothetical protein